MSTVVSKGCERGCKALVQDVCTQPVVTIPQYLTMERAACEMARHGISSLVVVDETDHFIGLLTATDVVRYFARRSNLCDAEWLAEDTRFRPSDDAGWSIDKFPAESVIRHMTRTVQTVAPQASVGQAREMMRLQKVHHLLLLDAEARPAGVVSSLDLL